MRKQHKPDLDFLRWTPDAVRKLFQCQECRAVYDGGWPGQYTDPQTLAIKARERLYYGRLD